MSMTDTISDMLSSIRNGQAVKLATVKCINSKINRGILDVLKEEGYIQSYKENKLRDGVSQIDVELRYFEGQPVIKRIERISKPGRRVYSQVGKLPKVFNGLGVSILSTSKGVMADHKARTENIGGEILCNVF